MLQLYIFDVIILKNVRISVQINLEQNYRALKKIN